MRTPEATRIISPSRTKVLTSTLASCCGSGLILFTAHLIFNSPLTTSAKEPLQIAHTNHINKVHISAAPILIGPARILKPIGVAFPLRAVWRPGQTAPSRAELEPRAKQCRAPNTVSTHQILMPAHQTLACPHPILVPTHQILVPTHQILVPTPRRLRTKY